MPWLTRPLIHCRIAVEPLIDLAVTVIIIAVAIIVLFFSDEMAIRNPLY